MTTTSRLRSSHGTWLAVHTATGALCHVPEPGDPATRPVVAHAPSDAADWLLLAGGGALSCPGEPRAAEVLAYQRLPLTGGVALRVPSTQKYLSADPDGSVTADRDAAGGWEVFTQEPLPGHAMRFDGIAGLVRPDIACIRHFARPDTADPAILAALLRLLPAADARQAAMEIRDPALRAAIFPALRLHLSGHQERFEWTTADRLRDDIARHGWQIGAHTYGAPEVIDGQHGRLSIGRYCSIAGNVQIVVANHLTRTAATYPFTSLHRFWPSADPATADHDGGGVIIGHNVWIGVGACLLPGARVGDGAVIGARAVVAGEVPPFAVVVGNPARVVRSRFAPEVVARMLRLQWWHWPDHVVDRFVPLLVAEDVAGFLAAAEAAFG